ncbi:Phosphatidylinositol 4,5-bisphosphate-binding protein SLM1 [Cladobotryum mycophilum]|uniref:Phosphatidylinositol 4,5-bisphosphate-binding protein SLM1 n=1 Tax=Cladobotryum mycophilum TaxID=491253 RepID=A0ABR0SUA8_9HYPO
MDPPQPQTSSQLSSDPVSISRYDSQSRLQPQQPSKHNTLQKQRRPHSYHPQSQSQDSAQAHQYLQTPSPQQQQQQQQQRQQLRNPLLGRFTEEWDASQRGSSILEGHRGPAVSSSSGSATMQRSNSVNSYVLGDDHQLPQRGNTLKKKSSLRRARSLVRSTSRRSMRAGSVKSLALQSASDPDEIHSVFYCPVPTSGSPTEILVNRFQTWRKVLKDLIAYYREIQSHYEQRAKSLVKLANIANNISTPPTFLKTAGIDDALQFIRSYNKTATMEANKAKEIEEDVILALTGLRSDLQQKIKEIKHLSGDFKNAVDKEMDNTAKAVRTLSDILEKNETDASLTTGKQDPYLLRLAVDRQIERQLDEENYLHQAYLNLEGSGRELESIIVGEIQKAYNAYAGILKREADNAYGLVGELRDGPISMPKDQEWIHFVTHDNRVVDPAIPLRSPDQIHYPGQDHYAAQEIRAGLLERKSKYLKSYTAGWYVLSTTHLHEFKSADKAQAPVMSLYLPDQKLGSHSSEGGSSNKFILKGRQTGTMHRGHTWVFRAESHDTMMAWYEDIKALTEKSPEERSHFVRTHSQRSLSRGSSHRSASSDGLDEEDEEPFQATEDDIIPAPRPDLVSRRSQPGGRFPSDIQVNAQRGLLAPQSPSVSSSQELQQDAQVIAAASAIPGAATEAFENGDQGLSGENREGYGSNGQTTIRDIPSQAAIAQHQAQFDGVNPYTSEPLPHLQTVHHGNDSGDDYYMTPIVVSQGYQNSEIVNGGQQQAYYSPVQQGVYAAGIDDGIVSREIDARGINGGHYTNAGDVNTRRISDAMEISSDAIPRSEMQKDIEGLQVVPDANTVPDGPAMPTSATEQKNTRPRAADYRTNSTATISNLHMPGGYPKSGVGSP